MASSYDFQYFFQFETKIYILQVRLTQYEYLGDLGETPLSTLSFAIRSFNAWFNSTCYHPHPHPPTRDNPKDKCPSCLEMAIFSWGQGDGANKLCFVVYRKDNFVGKPIEFVSAWLEQNNLSKFRPIFEGAVNLFYLIQIAILMQYR